MTMLTDKPRRRTSSTIPFGWRQSADDPKMIEQVAEELTLLMAALAYLDSGAGQRETARWLSHRSGRRISVNRAGISGGPNS
jgi:hypothetical protein